MAGWAPPYGYKGVASPNSPGKAPVVNQDEAAVVRLCYQMLVEDGMTTGEVAAELNGLGTRPRSAREWTHWESTAVARGWPRALRPMALAAGRSAEAQW